MLRDKVHIDDGSIYLWLTIVLYIKIKKEKMIIATRALGTKLAKTFMVYARFKLQLRLKKAPPIPIAMASAPTIVAIKMVVRQV
jgi:hypothetical protein